MSQTNWWTTCRGDTALCVTWRGKNMHYSASAIIPLVSIQITVQCFTLYLLNVSSTFTTIWSPFKIPVIFVLTSAFQLNPFSPSSFLQWLSTSSHWWTQEMFQYCHRQSASRAPDENEVHHQWLHTVHCQWFYPRLLDSLYMQLLDHPVLHLSLKVNIHELNLHVKIFKFNKIVNTYICSYQNTGSLPG